MGQKNEMAFLSAGMVREDGNLIAESPLVEVPYENLGKPFRPLFMSPNWNRDELLQYDFDAWWKMPIFKSGGYVNLPEGHPPRMQAYLLSRSDIIMTLRDQDGGAHYDAEITNEQYERLARDENGWAITKDDGPPEPVTGMIEAIAAQIGFELMGSILSYFPDIPTSIGRR